MSQIKAILSDADGTLVNTLYLIRHGQYEAAAEYLLERGIPRHDIPAYEVYELHKQDSRWQHAGDIRGDDPFAIRRNARASPGARVF